MRLETDRLIIRPICSEDKISVYNYRSDERTNKYQGWIPKTVNDVEIFINALSPIIDIPKTWFQVVIIEKEKQIIIGDVGVYFLSRQSNHVIIGYTLSKKFHGKGYASEALKEIMNYLFLSLRKDKIFALTDPMNMNSIDLLKRLGFKQEAKHASELDDRWQDDLIFVRTFN